MNPGEFILEFKASAIGYDGAPPLFAGFDFKIALGESICVVGPSGCGKSTLLLAFAGLCQLSAGMRELSPVSLESEIIYCPQTDFLLPWRSVEANIHLGSELGAAATRPPFGSSLPFPELFDFAHKRVDQLSGGMRKRVCLARSFARDPRLALLDEPFNNLDEAARKTLEAYVHSLTLALKSVVTVTHDLIQASSLGSRIIRFPQAATGKATSLLVLESPFNSDVPPAERRKDKRCIEFAAEMQQLLS